MLSKMGVEPGREKEIRERAQIYHCLQDNFTYAKEAPDLIARVRENNISTTINIISCLKNLLTYKDIVSINDIVEIEGGQYEEVLRKGCEDIHLSQYSQLLAVRLVREGLFLSSYPFVLLSFVYLGDIFQKIGLFRLEEADEERGKELYFSQPAVFYRFRRGRKEEEFQMGDLQRIGYSIHKIVTQIIRIGSKVFKYLPFHEKYCFDNNISAFYMSPFFKIHRKLQKSKRPLTSRFFYFKKDDQTNYKKTYATIEQAQNVKIFYTKILARIQLYTQQQCKNKQVSVDILSEHIFGQKEGQIKELLQILSKIAGQTNDRYIWGYLKIFLKQKFQSIEKQLSNYMYSFVQKYQLITSFFVFLSFMTVQLCNPEIAMFSFKHFREIITKIYQSLLEECLNDHQNISLAANFKNQRQNGEQNMEKSKLSSPKSRSSPRGKNQLPIQKRAEAFASLTNFIVVLNETCYIIYDQSKVLSFKHIYRYCQILLSFLPDFELVSAKLISQKLIRKQLGIILSKRKQKNKEKIQFLRVFQAGKPLFTSFDQSKLKLVQQIEEIKSNFKNVPVLSIYADGLREEDINIEVEDVAKQELQTIMTQSRQFEKNMMERSRFRLKMGNSSLVSRKIVSERKYKPSQVGSEEKRSSVSQFSFKESLKIDIKPVDRVIFKSLSKKRQVKKMRKPMKDLFKIKGALTSSIDVNNNPNNNSNNKIKSTSVPVQKIGEKESIKSVVYSEDWDNIFGQSCESNIRIPVAFDNRITSILQLSQHYTPKKGAQIHQSRLQQQHVQSSIQDVGVLGLSSIKKQPKSQTIYMDSDYLKVPEKHPLRLKSEENQSLSSLQIAEPKKTSEEISLQDIYKEQKKIKYDDLFFYFLPKVKKELLRNKILLYKNKYLEIGMITRPQENMLQNKDMRVRVSVYISALLQMDRLSANIRCPSWLVCKARANTLVDRLRAGEQKEVNFDVALRDIEEGEEHNYGTFPILNIAYFVDHQRQKCSKTIPFLVTKFMAEQKATKELEGMIQNMRQIKEVFEIHEKVAGTIEQIKPYCKQLKWMEVNKQKMRVPQLAKKDRRSNGSVGVARYNFIPNGNEILLIFMETEQDSFVWESSKIDKAHPRLYLNILVPQQQKWDYFMLHILKVCIKSIYSS